MSLELINMITHLRKGPAEGVKIDFQSGRYTILLPE